MIGIMEGDIIKTLEDPDSIRQSKTDKAGRITGFEKLNVLVNKDILVPLEMFSV